MHKSKDKKLSIISNEDRKNFQPDLEVLKDAVVTPWYRNQEQPQVLLSIFKTNLIIFYYLFNIFLFSIFM